METLEASEKSRVRGAEAGAPLSARATRLVALAGVGSFALIIVATFVAPPLWDAPGTNASPSEVAAYLQENGGRAIAGLYIYSLAMGLFLCFTAGLWSWLRQTEPAPQPLSAVFAFGAVALTVLAVPTRGLRPLIETVVSQDHGVDEGEHEECE